jgi:hypothetical protein
MSQLRYLAEAYFHQDYALDATTPLDLIREFRSSEPASDVAQLITDIKSFVTRDESAMRDAWLHDFGASYEPDRRDGMTYREWFERVLEILEGR